MGQQPRASCIERDDDDDDAAATVALRKPCICQWLIDQATAAAASRFVSRDQLWRPRGLSSSRLLFFISRKTCAHAVSTFVTREYGARTCVDCTRAISRGEGETLRCIARYVYLHTYVTHAYTRGLHKTESFARVLIRGRIRSSRSL